MAADFSQPQRQSKIGVLVMFTDTIRQYARALWPIIVIWLFKFDEINKLQVISGVIVFLIIIGIIAYLRYINFTFFLDNQNEEFVISEGVFSKTKTAIALDKIQQVNISQSLIQRIIGVYALDVDTAGSNSKEGKIKAVSHELALALKARLLDNEKKKSVVSDEPKMAEPIAEAKPFIKISFLSLLKVGITSNYIRTFGLLLAFFATIMDNIRHLGDNVPIDRSQFDIYEQREFVTTSVLMGIVIMMVLILIINVIRVIVKYFDFNISRQSGSLLLSFGLINTKSTIVKPEKVQITTVTRNYLQKKMNILELKIRQATSGEREERKSAIEIPGCNESERDAILKLLFKSIPEKGVMLTPNYRKLVFAIFLAIVLPLCGFFAFANYIDSRALDFAGVIPIYVLFVGAILFFGFRNYRLFINDNFIIKQSGAWDISNEIIEPSKIQAITTGQLFWHKSLNIGSLTIHTAGGNVAFRLGNYDAIKQYVNLWLYEIETSDSNWM